MRATYQITEYGSFVAEKALNGFVSIPQNTFDGLEEFILSNSSRNSEALDLMGLSVKKGIGKVITVKNYVGIITMKDGSTIEILPKIYSRVPQNEKMVKHLLVDMLRSLHNSPCKSIQTTKVGIERMNIFEIFIRMFIDEVYSIVKHGLKSDYERAAGNSAVFKGKLVVSQHIRNNYAHKERTYIAFDEYNVNRAENRLIKSTLLYLYRKTTTSKNKTDLRNLLNAFDEVKLSTSYEEDFSRISPDRNMADYATALIWCNVFLLGKSFTSFSGSQVAFALLFPMELLFESYIAKQLYKLVDKRKMLFSAQDRTYHLFDYPAKRFLMKPDIVVKQKEDGRTFIFDTKWKVLSDLKLNYGLSQADMYQMYAYHKKYDAASVSLIYPLCEGFSERNTTQFTSMDGVTVRIRFVDLFDVNSSLLTIISNLASD